SEYGDVLDPQVREVVQQYDLRERAGQPAYGVEQRAVVRGDRARGPQAQRLDRVALPRPAPPLVADQVRRDEEQPGPRFADRPQPAEQPGERLLRDVDAERVVVEQPRAVPGQVAEVRAVEVLEARDRPGAGERQRCGPPLDEVGYGGDGDVGHLAPPLDDSSRRPR